MPTRARGVCAEPGCGALVDHGGRCSAHQGAYERRRGSRIARGYDAAWLNLRERFMQQAEHQLCRHCFAQGRIVLATEADHIVPFHGRDDPNRLDWKNLQPLCSTCHHAKTIGQSRIGGAEKSSQR